MPVYELLGGLVRDRMKMYSWVGGDRPDEVIAGIRKLREIGFDTFKLNGCEEMALIDSNHKIDATIARIAEIRAALVIKSSSGSISTGASPRRWREF